MTNKDRFLAGHKFSFGTEIFRLKYFSDQPWIARYDTGYKFFVILFPVSVLSKNGFTWRHQFFGTITKSRTEYDDLFFCPTEAEQKGGTDQ